MENWAQARAPDTASRNPEAIFGEQDWEGEVDIWGHQIRVDYQGGPEPWALSGQRLADLLGGTL